jgi:hypothetical protein
VQHVHLDILRDLQTGVITTVDRDGSMTEIFAEDQMIIFLMLMGCIVLLVMIPRPLMHLVVVIKNVQRDGIAQGSFVKLVKLQKIKPVMYKKALDIQIA